MSRLAPAANPSKYHKHWEGITVKPFLSLSALALIAGVALSTGAHAADTCKTISGAYGDKATAALILGPDGKTLYGQMMNGGRPNFYGTCVNGKVDVKITDDKGCCTGTFDGTTVKWSNGTSWSKTKVN